MTSAARLTGLIQLLKHTEASSGSLVAALQATEIRGNNYVSQSCDDDGDVDDAAVAAVAAVAVAVLLLSQF